jgi:hypothetical protein
VRARRRNVPREQQHDWAEDRNLDPEDKPEPPIPRSGNEGRETVGAPEVSESRVSDKRSSRCVGPVRLKPDAEERKLGDRKRDERRSDPRSLAVVHTATTPNPTAITNLIFSARKCPEVTALLPARVFLIKPTAGARPASPRTLGRFIRKARTRGLTPDESRTPRTTPGWQRPLTDRPNESHRRQR